ncbi:hypothetical protein ABFT23_18630 [Nocardioides sp. C4-1]|uniref:hypothetical protein n=1 Tax=Nocardioides sp. C4-1 TaxID=3151851 RepID=UPI0032666715
MKATRWMPVLLSVPGLGLGVAGLFHPHTLTPATAERWYVLHVAGLVFFPLLGLALAALVRGRHDPVAWVVRLGAAGFALFYTSLDVIYGVAAGRVTRDMGEGYQRSADFSAMLATAVDLGEIGSWSLLVAGVALVVDRVLSRSWTTAAALVVPAGAWLVHVDHIFSPEGAVGAAVIGLATGVLAAHARNSPETRWESNAT